MAILATFPNSLIVTSRLEPIPYISLDTQLRRIFTIGGANNAPTTITKRNSNKANSKGVVESRKARGRSPKRVIRMPAVVIMWGLSRSRPAFLSGSVHFWMI
jgi:hypothetical protein